MPNSKGDTIRMVTKYEQIEHLIRSKIAAGELKPGDKIASEYELAQELGVHRFTVNKAISNLVRAALLYRVQGKGTFVAAPKEGVSSNCIGVVYGGLPEQLFKSAFGAGVVQGIYQGVERNVIFFGSAQSSITRGPEISDDELRSVEGLLAFEIFNDEYIERLAARKPVVAVDYWSEHLKVPAVVFQNVGATQRATKRLIELGHKRIACVGEDPKRTNTDPAWQERIKGWRQGMSEAGLSTEGLFVPLPARSGELGSDAAKEILGWKKAPTAVIVTSDGVAAHMMKVFAGAGVEMPKRMSIIGFGDEEVCQVVTPTLSSIGLDINDMGKRAAKLLERVIHGEHLAGTVETVETYYVERESVAAVE